MKYFFPFIFFFQQDLSVNIDMLTSKQREWCGKWSSLSGQSKIRFFRQVKARIYDDWFCSLVPIKVGEYQTIIKVKKGKTFQRVICTLIGYLQFPPGNLHMLNEVEISRQIGKNMEQICRFRKQIRFCFREQCKEKLKTLMYKSKLLPKQSICQLNHM